MKVSKGDKVVLVCLKNIKGVDFHAVLGKLVKVKKLYGRNIYTLKARRAIFLQGSTDLKNKEMDFDSQVFTLKLWNETTKEQLLSLRDAAQSFQALQHKFERKT